jgi:transcriptional regulator with XRE-family HTH domain
MAQRIPFEDPTMRAYYEGFQQRLKELREARGLTQPKMAKALGCSLDNYKKYESRDKSKFPLHLLEQLSVITDRSLEFIVTGTEAPARNVSAFRRRAAS